MHSRSQKNGAWDTGNYILRQLPEKQFYWKKKLMCEQTGTKEIKWEIEYKE